MNVARQATEGKKLKIPNCVYGKLQKLKSRSEKPPHYTFLPTEIGQRRIIIFVENLQLTSENLNLLFKEIFSLSAS